MGFTCPVGHVPLLLFLLFFSDPLHACNSGNSFFQSTASNNDSETTTVAKSDENATATIATVGEEQTTAHIPSLASNNDSETTTVAKLDENATATITTVEKEGDDSGDNDNNDEEKGGIGASSAFVDVYNEKNMTEMDDYQTGAKDKEMTENTSTGDDHSEIGSSETKQGADNDQKGRQNNEVDVVYNETSQESFNQSDSRSNIHTGEASEKEASTADKNKEKNVENTEDGTDEFERNTNNNNIGADIDHNKRQYDIEEEGKDTNTNNYKEKDVAIHGSNSAENVKEDMESNLSQNQEDGEEENGNATNRNSTTEDRHMKQNLEEKDVITPEDDRMADNSFENENEKIRSSSETQEEDSMNDIGIDENEDEQSANRKTDTGGVNTSNENDSTVVDVEDNSPHNAKIKEKAPKSEESESVEDGSNASE